MLDGACRPALSLSLSRSRAKVLTHQRFTLGEPKRNNERLRNLLVSLPPPPPPPLATKLDLTDRNGDGAPAEDARVQEDPAGDDLPHIVHHSSQLRHLDRHVADLLLRMRGPPLGHCSAGGAMYGVRCQVSREVQGSPERRLLAE